MQREDYIDIMIQSLKKKEWILDLLITKNDAQKQLLETADLVPEDLEQNMAEKGELIEKLTFLDEGFEQTFARIHDEIDQNREKYQDKIQIMQELITKITEKSNTVKIQEQKNRTLAEKNFAGMKRQIHQTRANYSQVSRYYRNMAAVSQAEARYVDHKK